MESRAEQAQGYRKEAERYAELASSGQRDITNFVHKRLAERFARMAEDLERLGSERIRPAPPIQRIGKRAGGAMIIDANELRGLADECVAAAAKCNDPDAAAKLLEIATKILELVRREMKPDIEQPFDGRRSAG